MGNRNKKRINLLSVLGSLLIFIIIVFNVTACSSPQPVGEFYQELGKSEFAKYEETSSHPWALLKKDRESKVTSPSNIEMKTIKAQGGLGIEVSVPINWEVSDPSLKGEGNILQHMNGNSTFDVMEFTDEVIDDMGGIDEALKYIMRYTFTDYEDFFTLEIGDVEDCTVGEAGYPGRRLIVCFYNNEEGYYGVNDNVAFSHDGNTTIIMTQVIAGVDGLDGDYITYDNPYVLFKEILDSVKYP